MSLGRHSSPTLNISMSCQPKPPPRSLPRLKKVLPAPARDAFDEGLLIEAMVLFQIYR
jgi:hypothetical protein